MQASASGSLPSARLLLERGSDVSVKDGKENTALWWALRHHHDDVAALLRKAGSPEPANLPDAAVPSPAAPPTNPVGDMKPGTR